MQQQQQPGMPPFSAAGEAASPISSRPPAAQQQVEEQLGGANGPGSGSSLDHDGLAGEDGDRGGSSAGNRRPRQETLALLKIRSEMDAAFREAALKGPLWEEVSRKLAEMGYTRSAKKCREKFENVDNANNGGSSGGMQTKASNGTAAAGFPVVEGAGAGGNGVASDNKGSKQESVVKERGGAAGGGQRQPQPLAMNHNYGNDRMADDMDSDSMDEDDDEFDDDDEDDDIGSGKMQMQYETSSHFQRPQMQQNQTVVVRPNGGGGGGGRMVQIERRMLGVLSQEWQPYKISFDISGGSSRRNGCNACTGGRLILKKYVKLTPFENILWSCKIKVAGYILRLLD
uniref:Myb/SANT-like DNA-binding domain-containing protein n=1 Tax=Oryza brachyantha TaxID=4533 RepID=J3LJ74_ORYBR